MSQRGPGTKRQGRPLRWPVAVLALASILLLAGCSPSHLMADAQPPGTILFGRGIDAPTFQLRGDLSQGQVRRDLAYRARLSQPAAGDIRVRVSIAGTDLEVEVVGAEYDSDYGLYAGTIPGTALTTPGELVMSVTDIGHSTLALGSITLVDAPLTVGSTTRPRPAPATDPLPRTFELAHREDQGAVDRA